MTQDNQIALSSFMSKYRMVNGTPMTQDNQLALSSFMSKESADRLALGLCEMRGAALKFGKILSIHDESLVPALVFHMSNLQLMLRQEFAIIFHRHANYKSKVGYLDAGFRNLGRPS
ncbi:predicted protein [Arabidopsis lyrata subsp. lyrata]|uniref:Predicted protein n=1 Tax=Arabidopsis lyrata subsp. lyrata TaxID=81972 RepID=D7KK52_ARALL|nr:predicted protein [Arabidopsis lyrata subsp. lyrata]